MDLKASQEQSASTLLGPELWGADQYGMDVKISALQMLQYILGSGKIVGGQNITVNYNNNQLTISSSIVNENTVQNTLDFSVVVSTQLAANTRVCSFKLHEDVTFNDFTNSTSHVTGSTVTAATTYTIHAYQSDFSTLIDTLGTLTWNPGVDFGTFALASGLTTPLTLPAGTIIDVLTGTQPSFTYCGFTLSFNLPAGENPSGTGTVTNVDITAGTGISVSGSPVTTSGSITVGLANSGVTAGYYVTPSLLIDPTGRVVSASNTIVIKTVEYDSSNNILVTFSDGSTTTINSNLGSAALQSASHFDVAGSASTAQTNAETFTTTSITALNLGTASTHASSDFDASGAATAVLSSSLQKSANLSDLTNAATARTNLGFANGNSNTVSTINDTNLAAAITTALTSPLIPNTFYTINLYGYGTIATALNYQGQFNSTDTKDFSRIKFIGTTVDLHGTITAVSAPTLVSGNIYTVTFTTTIPNSTLAGYITVNQTYLSIPSVVSTNASNYQSWFGCWKITAVSGQTFTVQMALGSANLPTAATTFTGVIYIMQTVINLTAYASFFDAGSLFFQNVVFVGYGLTIAGKTSCYLNNTACVGGAGFISFSEGRFFGYGYGCISSNNTYGIQLIANSAFYGMLVATGNTNYGISLYGSFAQLNQGYIYNNAYGVYSNAGSMAQVGGDIRFNTSAQLYCINFSINTGSGAATGTLSPAISTVGNNNSENLP